MAWRNVVLCVAVMALMVSSAAAQQPTYTVRLAQVIHHHGVGSPPTDTEQDACGVDNPCGPLSANGMQMLEAIGSHVRTRYNDPSIVAQPFFASRVYNATSIHATSSDLTTTIQSANAFLQGVFPATEGSSPAVFTVNHTTDSRISAQGIPFVWVKQDVDTAGLETALRASVDALFSDQVVQQMATEAHLTSSCADSARRVRCVLRLYNAYATLAALGQLASAGTLSNNAVSLTSVWSSYAQYLYSYNAANADDRTRGSAGQFIAAALVQNMRDSITSPRYTAYQYSADTTMLTPLALTLGISDAASLTPAFGSTIIIELLQRTSDSTYHVRVLRGAPSQLLDGSYTYRSLDTAQTCTAADGTNYAATDNICPLDDFARYVNTTKESTQNGHCALSQQSYALLNCPTTATQALSSRCAFYRELCPASACPSGYTLSAVDARCYSSSTAPDGRYVVRLVQVVHRHGARNPENMPNATQVCGGERECDRLNSFGIRMLYSVGQYIRNRYNNLDVVEQPLFASEDYDSNTVYTRSTAIQRTLQSATALLHGLFPNGNAFVPAVFSVNYTTDVFLRANVVPIVFSLRYVDVIGFAAAMNAVVDKLMTFDELTQAAEETHLWRNCLDRSIRYKCAFDMFDLATSYNATGRITQTPHLASMLDRLNQFRVQYYHYVFDYHANNTLHRRQGPVVYDLAQTIVANMQAHIIAPSYRMFHYSAHDSTVAPLSAAFGDITDTAMLAPYGVTMITELLQHTGNGSYFVRVLRGYPDGNYTSNYTFHDMGFEQHCLRADGTEYIQDICPLADFARYIESRKPIDPSGICIISNAAQSQLLCPALNSGQNPSDYYCTLYRTVCPQTSCPPGYVLDAANLQCYSINTAAAARILRTNRTLVES